MIRFLLNLMLMGTFITVLWLGLGGVDMDKRCVCGHTRMLHHHLHDVWYCSTCGRRRCSAFARQWWWYRFTDGHPERHTNIRYGIAQPGRSVYSVEDTDTQTEDPD